MLRKLILALLFVSILITTATATEYVADLTLNQIQGSDPSKSWVPLTRTLSAGETWDVGSAGAILIKYNEKDPNSNQITITISGTSISTPFVWAFPEGHTECIRGTCDTNASNSSSNAARLTLTALRASSSTINTTTDDPVTAYVNVNSKEISIPKDNMRTVDVLKTVQETGVSDTKISSEVYVYFTRKQSVPISISVKADPTEPKNEEWTTDRVKYTIDKAGTYTFTVKYTKQNAWGADTDTIDTYGLKLTNLGDGTTTSAGVSKYKSTIYLPDTLTVDMAVEGSFTKLDGVETIKLSGTQYQLAFTNPGTYSLGFTTAGGTVINDAVIATVRSGQATPEPTETQQELTGNQAQDGGSGGNNWWLYGGAFVALLAVLGIILTKKRGGGGGSGKYNIPD